MLLAGICAMVTGGGRGIGRGVALAYAQEGADVAVVSRTSSEVEQVAAEVRALARKGLALTADLTRREDADRAMRQAVEGLGKVDILVNNAGGYRLFTDALVHGVSFGDLTEAEWDRVIASNLKTTFLCCKAVLPHMVERGVGAVINMTSGASRKGGAGMAAYSAAKAGLDRLTESLAPNTSSTASRSIAWSRVGSGPSRTRTTSPRCPSECACLRTLVHRPCSSPCRRRGP